jgi:hypothetical protein
MYHGGGASCKLSCLENWRNQTNLVMEGGVEIQGTDMRFQQESNFEIKGIENLVDSLINCVPGHELPE